MIILFIRNGFHRNLKYSITSPFMMCVHSYFFFLSLSLYACIYRYGCVGFVYMCTCTHKHTHTHHMYCNHFPGQEIKLRVWHSTSMHPLPGTSLHDSPFQLRMQCTLCWQSCIGNENCIGLGHCWLHDLASSVYRGINLPLTNARKTIH